MIKKLSYDPAKRGKTLKERGLDFESFADVFRARNYTYEDEREDYEEPRFITIGYLHARMVVFVWTPRDTHYRIISMRKANDKEQKKYKARLD